MEFYDFPIILGIIMVPTDEVIFFRGAGIPPTRYDISIKQIQTGPITNTMLDYQRV